MNIISCLLLVYLITLGYSRTLSRQHKVDVLQPVQIKEFVKVQEAKKIDSESFLSIPPTSFKQRLFGPL